MIERRGMSANPKYNALGHATDMVFMMGPVVLMFGYSKGWSFQAGRWPTFGEKRKPQDPYGGFSFAFPSLMIGVFIEPMKAYFYKGQKQPLSRKLWGWYSAFDHTWYYKKPFTFADTIGTKTDLTDDIMERLS